MNGLKLFFHNSKYTMLSMFRLKVTLFWTLAFPLLLATFMYMAFGNLFEKDEMFKTINVAVVESENDDTLMSVLESLDVNHTDSASKSDDSSNSFSDLINMKLMDSSAAKKALNDKKVTGIIYTEDASLVVDENSYNATILESILTQYKQQKDVFTNIAKTNPAALDTAIAGLSDTTSEYKEISLSSGNPDEYTNYFYAVFAMSCLFASFSAVTATNRLLANTSPLGIRKSLAALSKNILIFSEYISLLIIHFVVELIALVYMTLLGVDFGKKYPAIILTLFFGCMIGLSIGVIIGAIPKLTEGSKIGISVGIGMVLSVLADLCANGIKDMIEHKLPIANRLNPACLISDCFYSLNVYDSYDRFFRNISIMAVESVILLIIAFALLRRKKYASI